MPPTLLLVDDEVSARYALRRAFESGYRLLEAGSVAEAREQLDRECPDVVLLEQGKLAGVLSTLAHADAASAKTLHQQLSVHRATLKLGGQQMLR